MAAGVTNFPDENAKPIPARSVRQNPARLLSPTTRRSRSGVAPPDEVVQHIAPPVDIRSRTTLFVFIGIAIVLIGAIGLMWPATSPRDSTTTVNPVTDTAGAPQDSGIRVAPIVKEIFGSTIPSGSTTRDRRLQELLTQYDRISSRFQTYGTSPSDQEKAKEDLRALSKIQKEMNQLQEELDKEARDAIRSIKP